MCEIHLGGQFQPPFQAMQQVIMFIFGGSITPSHYQINKTCPRHFTPPDIPIDLV